MSDYLKDPEKVPNVLHALVAGANMKTDRHSMTPHERAQLYSEALITVAAEALQRAIGGAEILIPGVSKGTVRQMLIKTLSSPDFVQVFGDGSGSIDIGKALHDDKVVAMADRLSREITLL